MKYRVGDIIKSAMFSGHYFVMDVIQDQYLLLNIDFANKFVHNYNIPSTDELTELVTSILREEDV